MRSDAQGIVERMIGEGVPFEDIEQYIETLPLPSEQLSALWLLAWAEATDPVTRRRVVADALAAPKDPPRSQLAAAPSLAARASPRAARFSSAPSCRFRRRRLAAPEGEMNEQIAFRTILRVISELGSRHFGALLLGRRMHAGPRPSRR